MSPNATGEPVPIGPQDSFLHVGTDAIDPAALYRRASRPEVGAIVQFCGTVRNHNQNASVVDLEYDAYKEMALEVVGRIVATAFDRWRFWTASAVHRTGPLTPGDIAVCVTVGASHREEAFAACRYIIDQLKSEAPIWKRETLESGDRRWLDEQSPPAAGPES